MFLKSLGMFINSFWHYLGESCVNLNICIKSKIYYIYTVYCFTHETTPGKPYLSKGDLLLYVVVKTHTPLFPTQVTFISMNSLCSLLCFPCFETMKTTNPTQLTNRTRDLIEEVKFLLVLFHLSWEYVNPKCGGNTKT